MNEQKAVFPQWRYRACDGAVIWRLMFTETGMIVGQTRLPEQRRSLFFSLAEHSGQVQFDDFMPMAPDGTAAGESWFTGIETVAGKLVFLHAYRDNSPEHLGIWAVDASAGTVVWSRADMVFCGVLDEGFLVYRHSSFAGFPERHYLILDPATGREVRRPGQESEEVNRLRAGILPEEQRQGVVLPEFTDSNDSRNASLFSRDAGFAGRCEALCSGSLAVAACHDYDETTGKWQSLLRVRLHGVPVYEDAMAESSVRPAVSSFLVHGGSVYYIKGESELVALKT
jgi:hypothetical protein